MKAYECDICRRLFADKQAPILPSRSSSQRLMIAIDDISLSTADICPNCLTVISNTVRMLAPWEELDEPEASSSEC